MVKRIDTAEALNQFIDEHPDRNLDDGCILSKTCKDCSYKKGTIDYTLKCINYYKNRMVGMRADLKRSVLFSLFENGISVTFLADAFNMTKPAVRMAIARYSKEERSN